MGSILSNSCERKRPDHFLSDKHKNGPGDRGTRNFPAGMIPILKNGIFPHFWYCCELPSILATPLDEGKDGVGSEFIPDVRVGLRLLSG